MTVIHLARRSPLRLFAATVGTNFQALRFPFRQVRKMEHSPKPLNVLVFTGETSSENKCERFQSIASTLKYFLHPDCYLIYHLTPAQVAKEPWQQNLKLLVVSANVIPPEIATAIGDYASLGGNVFVSCSDVEIPALGISSVKSQAVEVVNVNFKELDVAVLRDIVRYKVICSNTEVLTDHHGSGVVFKLEGKNVLLSEICLERDPLSLKCENLNVDSVLQCNAHRLDILKTILLNHFSLKSSEVVLPDLTPCFLFVSSDLEICDIAMKAVKEKSHSSLELLPVDCSTSNSVPAVTERHLPVLYNFKVPNNLVPFNIDVYLASLNASTFGRSLFFIPVVGSTMDVIVQLDRIEGACVVARQQVKPKGRGCNKWISPLGSASFSLHFSLSLSSKLGQRISLIQHMLATSVVMAVRKTSGYEAIDLYLKWPNDIYSGSNVKIGGVLATSSLVGNIANIFTGCGINVSNSLPTLCINDLIQLYNTKFGTKLAPFSTEQLIASSLSELEQLIIDFQANGSENFLRTYYKYWLHGNKKVTLEATGKDSVVTGINDYGYLVVRDHTGKELSLMPDGNSFDIMRNLIVAK